MKFSDYLTTMIASRPADVPSLVLRRLKEAVSRQPSGVAVTRFGEVQFPVDLSLHAITRKYFFRTHEMFLERVFRTYLSPGDTFIDIGSNMGYWSAFSASLVGRSGVVHAFEPVPRFFASVAGLAAANPGYAIHVNQVALGAAEGIARINVVEPTAGNYDNYDTNIGSSSMLDGVLQAELTRSVEVRVTTFDSYMREHEIDADRIGLIKIDVEGYESYCFEGMRDLLERPGRKVPILCEVLTDRERNPLLDGRRIVERLESHGYRCLDALDLKPVDVAAMPYEANLVCVGRDT